MNLFYLRYFVTLAHVQQYTKAAEQLCIAQPSLSHAIAQMEKELGLPLFEKSGRKNTLTRFGQEFLACAEHTLAILDAGIESLQRSARGEGVIRLGFLRTLGVELIPKLAAEFLKRNPQMGVDFSFHTGVTQSLLEGLTAGKFDLVFCSEPPARLNFTAIPIQKQDLVLIVPKTHPLASFHTINLSQTESYPQVFFEKSSGIRPVVDQMFSKIGVEPRIAYETEEDQVIAGLVAQGFGIAVVPYMDLLLKLDVKILKIDSPACERALFMVNDDSRFMAPCVQAFRQFVLDGDFMQQSFGQIGAILIVVGVAHIGDALAAVFLRGIRTGEGHNLDALVNQIVDGGSDHFDVGHIDADHVKATSGSLFQTHDLIGGVRRDRGHILVVDGNAPLSILGRSILQAHADRIPPGMDDFVGKVEVILVFLGFVVIQLHIEADRIVHGLIADGIAAGRNRIFPGRIAGRGGRGVGRRCSGAGIAASSAVGTVGTAGGQSEHHGQRKQNGQ